jgi:hypothetical protein
MPQREQEAGFARSGAKSPSDQPCLLARLDALASTSNRYVASSSGLRLAKAPLHRRTSTPGKEHL